MSKNIIIVFDPTINHNTRDNNDPVINSFPTDRDLPPK